MTILPQIQRRGDADAALASAAIRIDATYRIARENHNPMEPHATIAAWTGDTLTVWSKSQFVVSEAEELAAIFGCARKTCGWSAPTLEARLDRRFAHGRTSRSRRWPPDMWDDP